MDVLSTEDINIIGVPLAYVLNILKMYPVR